MKHIHAISPIDGRYSGKVLELSRFYSEKALMYYRIKVEVEYFIALCTHSLDQLKTFDASKFEILRDTYRNFTDKDALEIKEIEEETNHDVKAIEYFIKRRFDVLGISEFKEFIHFGLTSQDINNTAIPLSLKEGFESYEGLLNELLELIREKATQWHQIPMLSRTHGQPASPTLLGKEFMVFVSRLEQQYKLLKSIPFSAKFSGATGNFNAHVVSYPKIDWLDFSKNFISDLGLTLSFPTTQIEHYDNLAAFCDGMKRINTILIDLNRDVWQYISMNYFGQKINSEEVGSSAMPHKVNPIDFENAEGNLGVANAVFNHLASKLPISRLQRDLTDSTVLRNIGVPIAHTFIAIKSTIKGLNKLTLNRSEIKNDLEHNWLVTAEAIQTILRRENYPSPYEVLKGFTRKQKTPSKADFDDFIDGLEIREKVKRELKRITPFNYTGLSK